MRGAHWLIRTLLAGLIFFGLGAGAAEFLSTRIGSGRPDSLPVFLQLTQEEVTYKFQFEGRDDLVQVIVSGGAKPCVIRLFAADFDAFLTARMGRDALADNQATPENSVRLLCQPARNAPHKQLALPKAHPCLAALARLIGIYRLPVYVVQQGDTMESVLMEGMGGKYTVQEVLQVNPGLDAEALLPGQEIKVPAGRRHKPKP